MATGQQGLASLLRQFNDDLRTRLRMISIPSSQATTESLVLVVIPLLRLYNASIHCELQKGEVPQAEVIMWRDCFDLPLNELRSQNPRIHEEYIEFGIAYYERLLEDICTQYQVLLNDPNVSGSPQPRMLDNLSMVPVNHLIQKYLIRIGDLLCHDTRFYPALAVYKKVVILNTSCGLPWFRMGHTQSLINGSSTEGHLVSVSHYTRALAVPEPWMAAKNNLESLLESVGRVTPATAAEEFFYAYLLRTKDLMRNVFVTSPPTDWMSSMLKPLILSNDISSSQLHRVITIALYLWWKETPGMVVNVRLVDDCQNMILAVLNSILWAADSFVGPIEKFFAVEHCKILLEWTRANITSLNPGLIRAKLRVDLLSRYVTKLRESMCKNSAFRAFSYEKKLLQEEKDLLGFLPMNNCYDGLSVLTNEEDPQTAIRAYRTVSSVNVLSDALALGLNLQTGLPNPKPLSYRRNMQPLNFAAFNSSSSSDGTPSPIASDFHHGFSLFNYPRIACTASSSSASEADLPIGTETGMGHHHHHLHNQISPHPQSDLPTTSDSDDDPMKTPPYTSVDFNFGSYLIPDGYSSAVTLKTALSPTNNNNNGASSPYLTQPEDSLSTPKSAPVTSSDIFRSIWTPGHDTWP